MALAEIHKVLDVPYDKLFDAITCYEDYPEFVNGCDLAEVHRKKGKPVRVTYKMTLVKAVTYTLDHVDDRKTGKLTWSLVDSDIMKKNAGEWELKALSPDKTDVKYQVEVEFKVPVPKFVLNQLIKSNLPNMLKNFSERARSL